MACLLACNLEPNCISLCTRNDVDCTEACPCNAKCPNGCPCSYENDYCVSCQAENQDQYYECELEMLKELDLCILNCPVGVFLCVYTSLKFLNTPTSQPFDGSCSSQCFDRYNNNMKKCPCMEKCPSGCPCPQYNCVLSTTTPTRKTTTVQTTPFRKLLRLKF